MSSFQIFLNAANRSFGWLVQAMSGMASAWIFVIMLMIAFDIILRFVFGAPIDGVTEIVEISIVIILFLQMTNALRSGRITRSDALFSKIMKRAPKIGHAMGAAFNLAGVYLMVVIIGVGWPKWVQAYQEGFFVGNAGVFTFPEWPQRLILVIGCAVMAIQFLLFAIDNFRGMAGKPALASESESEPDAGSSDRSLLS
jgi:TRAP-type mannitol/chloroaromatic compound transport system permease small subunit